MFYSTGDGPFFCILTWNLQHLILCGLWLLSLWIWVIFDQDMYFNSHINKQTCLCVTGISFEKLQHSKSDIPASLDPHWSAYKPNRRCRRPHSPHTSRKQSEVWFLRVHAANCHLSLHICNHTHPRQCRINVTGWMCMNRSPKRELSACHYTIR